MRKAILAISVACAILITISPKANAAGHHGYLHTSMRAATLVHMAAYTRRASRIHYAARGRVHSSSYVREVQTSAIAGALVGGASAARPHECYGIQWCGCWLRSVLGLSDSSLDLAINWAHVGSSASPESANVVVWRHHVGKLLTYEKGRILIQSGNDRGAVRTRWVSPHILGGVVAYRKV